MNTNKILLDMNGIIDENIHPCKGCEDYIPPKDCKSNGGCGRHNIFYEHMPEDFTNAVETIMGYCQNEDCDDDCSQCPHSLAEIRCGDTEECPEGFDEQLCDNCTKYDKCKAVYEIKER